MIDSFLKYLQFERRLSNNTVLSYQADLLQFQGFITSDFPDSNLVTADFGIIRCWIITLVEAKVKATSINRKIACLKSFYKFLLRQQAIKRNPTLKVRVLKTPKKLPVFVQEKDITNLLRQDFDKTFEGVRDRLILELFYGTGIRLSELINLRERNVDLHSRTIKVLGKRNKERVIPFTTPLASLLKEYKRVKNRDIKVENKDLLLVTEDGSACYPMLVYRVVKNHLKNTSAEKTNPHILRHTYATHLLDHGAEINAVKDLLGHTSLAATQVYTHNSMEKLKKAFDQAHPKA